MTHLYVCHFSNGHIKVGRSVDPKSRIAQHCERVSCFGIELVDHLIIECKSSAIQAETLLIDKCIQNAEKRNKSEWFEGLDYSDVCDWATVRANFMYAEQIKGPHGSLTSVFAKNVAKHLADNGLSERAFALKSGLQQKAINRIIRADNSPTLDTVELVANAIGVSPWELLKAASEQVAA